MPDNRLERHVPPDMSRLTLRRTGLSTILAPHRVFGAGGPFGGTPPPAGSLLAERSGPETRTDLAGQRGTGLVDLLDRVLDKGLLIAGDIRISLAEVERLIIRIRLIVCSIDKAQEIGLDWWKYDRHLAPGTRALAGETEALRRQVRTLERRIALLTARRVPTGRRPARRRTASTASTGG